MSVRTLPKGLPGPLPAGERVLWQGSPGWRGLALGALHVRGLALYLGLIVAWVAVAGVRRGAPGLEVAFETGRALLVACVPVAVCLAYAWLAARAATYTITSRRVVIRLGVAMNMTLNLPFERIDGADIAVRADGSGDIALTLAPRSRNVSWMILWPHARAWRRQAEPMLRAVPDAAAVGQMLSRLLAESADAPVPLAQGAEIVESGPHHHGDATVAA